MQTAALFAYGQSGGGKTYSMVGGNSTMDSDLRGIIPRTCQELYRQLDYKVPAANLSVLLWCTVERVEHHCKFS